MPQGLSGEWSTWHWAGLGKELGPWVECYSSGASRGHVLCTHSRAEGTWIDYACTYQPSSWLGAGDIPITVSSHSLS